MTDVSGTMGAKGEKFLNKAERKACWDARDQFWTCMEKNSEQIDSCQATRKEFERLCPGTWVTHFDRKFQYNKFKTEFYKKGPEAIDKAYAQYQKKE